MTNPVSRKQGLVNKRNLFVLVSFIGLLCGCKREVRLQKGEYLLYNQSFEENEIVTDETLESLVPLVQKPNNRPLYLPVTPRVWWMNIGKNTFDSSRHATKLSHYLKKTTELTTNEVLSAKESRLRQKYERKANRLTENLRQNAAWFWRTVGENPTIIAEDDIKATAFKIKKYLFDSGFRDAEVNYEIESVKNRKPKVNLTYIIEENAPYIIDSVVYDFHDDSLKNAVLSDKTPSFVTKGLRFSNQFTEAEKTRI